VTRTRLGLAVLAVHALSGAAAAACAPDTVTVRGAFGEAAFRVEIADDPEERAQGLMFVEEMPTFEGMLFVYESPRRASFWMHNTLIPLDMLFADPGGVITRIHQNAIPLDRTSIDGGEGVLYVLEINGGLSERFGIAEGDRLIHPVIDAAGCD